jgi:hypothetical protein
MSIHHLFWIDKKVLPLLQIISRYCFSRYIVFSMHLNINMSSCMIKTIYIKKSEQAAYNLEYNK